MTHRNPPLRGASVSVVVFVYCSTAPVAGMMAAWLGVHPAPAASGFVALLSAVDSQNSPTVVALAMSAPAG